MAKIKQADNQRHIYTYFFEDGRRKEVLKTNVATYLRSAVMRASDALAHGHYPGARVAVVYDNNYGCDHAVITMHADGRVETMYKRDHRLEEFSQRSKFPIRKVSRQRNPHTTDKLTKGKVVPIRKRA